ncbi:MAG: cytochrome c biogenesis protein CcsA [Wenzhouxiangellaceae bacterium]
MILESIVLLCYLCGLAVLLTGLQQAPSRLARIGIMLVLAGVVAHGMLFLLEYRSMGTIGVDFFSALSLVAWLLMLILLVSSLRHPVAGLLIIALPGAVTTVVLDLLLGASPRPLDTGNAMIDLHVAVSLIAYAVLAVAATVAVSIAITHRSLQRHHASPMLDALPPLVTMERLLFAMITVGWVVLTLSLLTGWLFVDDLLAQHLVHKTVLSVISWLLFGLLLAGRRRFGWRGMIAVRLCLLAMAVLILAYFGSKAVLELLLQQQWSAR